MKKIIRHVLYKTQCQFCGTEFAFEKSDLELKPSPFVKRACKLSWCGKLTTFTECPKCGKETPATADQSTQIINLIKDKNAVMHIAKMQQQIDTFKAALLHINERITHGNKCDMVVIDPLDDFDKHHLKTIFKFIDEHTTTT